MSPYALMDEVKELTYLALPIMREKQFIETILEQYLVQECTIIKAGKAGSMADVFKCPFPICNTKTLNDFAQITFL